MDVIESAERIPLDCGRARGMPLTGGGITYGFVKTATERVRAVSSVVVSCQFTTSGRS